MVPLTWASVFFFVVVFCFCFGFAFFVVNNVAGKINKGDKDVSFLTFVEDTCRREAFLH